MSVLDQIRRFDTVFHGISDVYPICHHLRDIRNRNVHDFVRDLQNGPNSIENISNKSHYTT